MLIIPETNITTMAPIGNQGGIKMWPSEETSGTVYDIANIILIGALVIGAAATATVVWMGNVKDGYSKIAAASAAERVAVAERDAANARLQLERLKAPRTLNESQRQSVLEAVAAHAGTKFDLAVQASDPEAAALCSVLWRRLSS